MLLSAYSGGYRSGFSPDSLVQLRRIDFSNKIITQTKPQNYFILTFFVL